MSMATVVNALLDIVQFDYTSYACRDLEDMLDEIQAFLPDLLAGSFNKNSLIEKLNGMLQDVSSFEKGPTKKWMWYYIRQELESICSLMGLV
jgi:hypothetical protein